MKKNYLKYISALILFGLNGIVASSIALSSYEIVMLRTFIGSILLLILFLSMKNKFTFYKHKKSFVFLIISGIAMGASWMFLYEAYQEIGVSLASIEYYCGPVIVMILSPIIFKEKLTYKKILGFICVVAGILLVDGQEIGNIDKKFGIFCGAMSAVMYAFMVIGNKKAKEIKGFENALLQLIISFITVAIFVIIKQGLYIHVQGGDWCNILVLGLLNTGIGCYLYFTSIGGLPINTVAILGYLEPLSAVVFSAVFLSEMMTSIQILGACMILGGAMFSELSSE